MSFCSRCGAQQEEGATFCRKCGKPAGGVAAGGGPAKAKNSKTTWIVVGCILIPVGLAFLGIFAAIFIPNFLDALQKAKQKRTVAELKGVCELVDAYRAKHGSAPTASDMAGVEAAIREDYGGVLIPRLDGWKHPYRYSCWRSDPNASGCDHYRLASAGRDGSFEQNELKDYEPGIFPREQYDHDIVFGDSGPVQVPGAGASTPPQ